MNELIIFTDGSVHNQTKTGYGAYLALNKQQLTSDSFADLVKVKRFDNTSSVKLEIQTLIWALNELGNIIQKVTVYTDSQNILSLPERRERLELNKYYSKNGRLISNHELYREFYKLTDKLLLDLVKVQGHKKQIQKDRFDKLFALVDRASRNALRKNIHVLVSEI